MPSSKMPEIPATRASLLASSVVVLFCRCLLWGVVVVVVVVVFLYRCGREGETGWLWL